MPDYSMTFSRMGGELPELTQMLIRVGEESNRLADMFGRSADLLSEFYVEPLYPLTGARWRNEKRLSTS